MYQLVRNFRICYPAASMVVLVVFATILKLARNAYFQALDKHIKKIPISKNVRNSVAKDLLPLFITNKSSIYQQELIMEALKWSN